MLTGGKGFGSHFCEKDYYKDFEFLKGVEAFCREKQRRWVEVICRFLEK